MIIIIVNFFCLDMFKERDPDNKNIASFTMEEWVEKTLYS